MFCQFLDVEQCLGLPLEPQSFWRATVSIEFIKVMLTAQGMGALSLNARTVPESPCRAPSPGCPTCSQSPDNVLHSLPSNFPIKCPDIWVPLHRMLRKISHNSQHGLGNQVHWEDGRSAMKKSNPATTWGAVARVLLWGVSPAGGLGSRWHSGAPACSPFFRSSSVGMEPWHT